jgi:hypothetical protein
MMLKAFLPRYPASAHRCLDRRLEGDTCLAMTALITQPQAAPRHARWPLSRRATRGRHARPPAGGACSHFSPIRRVTSHCLLAQGRLEHRPVDASPSAGDALKLVTFGKTHFSQRLEEPRLGPLRELLMLRADTAQALTGLSLPLAARPEH